MPRKVPGGLALDLPKEQLEQLRPLIDTMGTVKVAGEVRGEELTVSFIACNAAFLACNAAFRIGGEAASAAEEGSQ